MIDFLNSESFRTPFDGQHTGGYAVEQYNKGRTLGSQGYTLVIAVNKVWSAVRLGSDIDSRISSYEKLGYHACTADLLQGFLDSQAPIYAYNDNGVKEKVQ